jgi:hypothetical protein
LKLVRQEPPIEKQPVVRLMPFAKVEVAVPETMRELVLVRPPTESDEEAFKFVVLREEIVVEPRTVRPPAIVEVAVVDVAVSDPTENVPV